MKKHWRVYILCILSLIILSTGLAFAAQEEKVISAKYDVDLFKSWTIKFNQALDTDSVNYDRVKIIESQTEKEVIIPKPYKLSEDKESIILDPPIRGYKPDTTYTILIKDLVSESGKGLTKLQGWTLPPDLVSK